MRWARTSNSTQEDKQWRSNVSPIEVEGVLMAHPAVCDAAVIGIPDAFLGQRIVGLVKLADNADKSALANISPIRGRGLLTTRPRNGWRS
jgi:acyl-CoA synthetase (AMP-forming)/AMP-acid ligase II